MKKIVRFCCFLTLGLCASAFQALAQDNYPMKPLRLVVPTGAGGVTDLLARMIAQRLGDALGQPVLVDNKPGAGGIIGTDLVAKAPADGYTLLMAFPSHAVNPALYAKIPYDTERDFAPVTLVSGVAAALTVSATSEIKTLQDLIALAKSKPGAVNYASAGNGSLAHIAAELLAKEAGVRFTQIPYKSGPAADMAVIGGEVTFYFGIPITTLPLMKSGKVRALGVTTKARLAQMPDVPAIGEIVTGFEAVAWNGILVPAKTPQAVVNRLHSEIVKILRAPDMRAQLLEKGVEPVANTPAEFSAILKTDLQKWAKLLREAGIKAE